MTRNRPVRCFSRSFANHDLGRYEVLPASSSALPWDTKRAAGTQAGCQLAPQCASALHVQCLVDCFGADPHRSVVRKLVQEPSRDLFWAPSCCPPPVLPTPMPTAFPSYCRPMNSRSAWARDNACQSILNVTPQRYIHGQLGDLWPTSRSLGVPLRRCGTISESTAPSGCVASNLA